MKVILLQELKGKGGEGDVVDVAPGFANNYLMPQGIAILATKGNLKQLEMRKNNIAKREATRLADADKLKSVLDEEGQLFGSVTATQIAEAIKEALGVEIDRRRIEAGKAIKTAGQHEVVISIYRDIKATVTLLVGIDEVAAEEEAEEVETEAVAEEAAAAEEAAE